MDNNPHIKDSRELKALFHLLDDPDREVYETVSDKIIHYGKEIIPKLEHLWESTTDGHMQERIEEIIHKVNYQEVYVQLQEWFASEAPGLLEGALILANYRYSSVDEQAVRKVMKSIYQSCWLELNNYLTPLEQINIVNSIFYNMYKFSGSDSDELKPLHFYLNEVMESRQGNQFSLGLLYQVLCDMLDIPVYAIRLPKQHILAYFDTQYDFYHQDQPMHKIQFYIDPSNGLIYTQNDVDVFVNKFKIPTDDQTFLPYTHQQWLGRYLDALIQTYQASHETEKVDELSRLRALAQED